MTHFITIHAARPAVVLIVCLAAILPIQSGFAATPAPAKAPAAQSSEDVLKWLQLSSNKSANNADKDAKQDAAKSATNGKDNKEANKETTAKLADPAPAAPVLVVPTVMAQEQVAELPKVATAMIPANAVNTPIASAVPTVSALRVITREQPKFPQDAQNNGITSGKVKALLYVAADGSVSKVEILEASPKRVFDRAVTAAAMHWKYAPIAAPETTEVVFAFNLE